VRLFGRIGTGRQARRSVRALTVAASRFAAGDLSVRVSEQAADEELARLETAFNHMADVLEERIEKAAEETRGREAFFAQVSHELRTPLTSIVGYGDLLLADARGLERIDPAERLEALETTDRNSRRLLRLVNDLLFAARVGADMLRLQHSDYDASVIARQAVDAAEPAAASAGISLYVEVPRAAPARGDAGRMTQALDNLLSNAIKFTHDRGRAGVRVRRDEDTVTFEVWDTGTGIPEEAVPHLFERFYRGPGALEAPGQGVGLGLPIARAIVEAHGGTISVETAEGEGSTFSMTIPVGVTSPEATQAT
jgi:two-component system, OmpR family, phosphate regulon sensor histidine kinase PhoR